MIKAVKLREFVFFLIVSATWYSIFFICVFIRLTCKKVPEVQYIEQVLSNFPDSVDVKILLSS